ncbi:hypothetical protein BC829DRAFT_445645 [Chytridium lagenaria]|nr:hypothetical protein BC829DRAFT_445645 [Chytridium lagenaria]
MPSALEVYEADPDYQATEALSLIPPPRMDPPSTQRNNFRDRDRGGFNRGGRGGGRFDNRARPNASFGTQNRDDRNPHREPMGRRGHEEPKHEQREARGKVADHVQRPNSQTTVSFATKTWSRTFIPKTPYIQPSPQNFQRGRSLSNPYENIGRSIFVNRSAVKMASIDRLMRHESTHGLIRGPEFTFADVCAGPGGFVEYVLWRCATQKVILRNLRMFRRLGYHYDRDGWKGVHLVMADGGFSCQVMSYTKNSTQKNPHWSNPRHVYDLREGGDFIIKTFDLFTPFTISLLYLLRASFHLFAITKPTPHGPPIPSATSYVAGYLHRSIPIVTHLEETLRKLMEGFVKVEERVGLGLLDVVEVVRREVVMADKDFVEYVENSNMKNSRRKVPRLHMIKRKHEYGV